MNNSEKGPQSPEEVMLHQEVREHWQGMLEGLGVESDSASDEAFGEVIQRYSEGDGRAYHNIGHVKRMLEFVDEYSDIPQNMPVLKAAIFGHDIVYEPGSRTNEKESEEIFGGILEKMEVSEENIAEVRRLINLTVAHKASADDVDGKLLIDADLSIFGAESIEYMRYTVSIWSEYVGSGSIAQSDFRRGRRSLVEGWLHQLRSGNLFQTPEVGAKLKDRARINLQAEAERLAPRVI